MGKLYTIHKFLEQEKYFSNPNVEGIIFYGSANRGGTYSDIDLLLIMRDGVCMRGCTYVNGTKIDYHERTISSILEEIEGLDTSLNRSLFSIFKTGTVLYQNGGAVDYLKTELESYEDLPRYKKNADFRLEKIDYLLNQLQDTTDIQYNKYIYYILLEEMRKYYHETNGYSKISSHKVKRLYQDKDEAEDAYFLHLPPSRFRVLYLELLKGYDTIKFEQFKKMVKLKDRYREKRGTTLYFQPDELKYKSTAILDMLEKCMKKKKSRAYDFESIYFLTLEKIRAFYANMHEIETYPCELYPLDLAFIGKIEQAIENEDVGILFGIFKEITESFKLNYHDYKIKTY